MKQLLIKNGIIYDGLGGEPYKLDILIDDGKIIKIEENITEEAISEIDAKNHFVTPGLVDHHMHIYPMGKIGAPSEICFSSGVTTAVDAGSLGCRNYEERRGIIDASKLRIKAYLHISSYGLDTLPVTEDLDPEKIEVENIKKLFEKYPNELLGLKLRTSKGIVKERGLEPLYKTIDVADELNVPICVHITDPPVDMDELLKPFRHGDLVTHMYQNKGFTILDENKKIAKAVLEARDRGVLFEAADARGHFSFEVSEPAIEQGFLPDFLATDITKLSMNLRPTAFNMAMQLAKYNHIGIDFKTLIKLASYNPAKNMGLVDEIGSLEEGKIADIAIFRPVEKENEFGDRTYAEQDVTLRTGNKVYQPVLTVKDGEMVYRDVTF